jgi:hypothetical protein
LKKSRKSSLAQYMPHVDRMVRQNKKPACMNCKRVFRDWHPPLATDVFED